MELIVRYLPDNLLFIYLQIYMNVFIIVTSVFTQIKKIMLETLEHCGMLCGKN